MHIYMIYTEKALDLVPSHGEFDKSIDKIVQKCDSKLFKGVYMF